MGVSMAITLGLWLDVGGAKLVVSSQVVREQVDIMSEDLSVACGKTTFVVIQCLVAVLFT